jgi:DNA-binding MarR family transcriptional regulator
VQHGIEVNPETCVSGDGSALASDPAPNRANRKEGPRVTTKEIYQHRRGSVWKDEAGRGQWPDREGRVRLLDALKTLKASQRGGPRQGRITASAIRVFEFLLFDCLNMKTGACFPSYETIAARLGCAINTVVAAIERLEHYGFIRRTRRKIAERIATARGVIRRYRQTSNAYRFLGWEADSNFRAQTTIKNILKGNDPEKAEEMGPLHFLARLFAPDKASDERAKANAMIRKQQLDLF